MTKIKKKRILAYFYHCQTLGHSRRILNLCRELKRKGEYEVILVSGGQYPAYFEDANEIEILQIPTLIPKTNLFQGHQPKNLSLPLKSVMNIRSKMLNSICREYEPDLVICEFFPFGRFFLDNEIKSMIKTCKKVNSEVKVISCMRDIWGVNLGEGMEKRTLAVKIIRNYFDKILIHGVPEINDFHTEFPDESLKKFLFTGYVLRRSAVITKQQFLRTYNLSKESPIVIVSVGGGKDGQEVIKKITQLAKQTPQIQYLFFVGPYYPDELMLKSKVAENIVMTRFHDNYPSFLEHADLIISMSGYNTMTDVLKSRTASIVFPRKSEEEQYFRALAFEKLGLCVVADEEIPMESLKKLILKNIKLKRPNHALNVEGVKNTYKAIKQMLES